MNIDEILDIMDEMLDKSWSLPLSGGRCVIDVERMRDLIDDLRINLPTEIKQAQSIVSDRSEILSTAKREGETIIRKAEERAQSVMNQQEIVKQAQKKANEILTQAQIKSKEVRHAAQNFSDETLRTAEELMIKSVNDIRTTRQAIRNSSKQQSQQQNFKPEQ